MSDISIWKRFCKWLRTWRRCEHCGKRSNDTTRGSAFCGNCEGGYGEARDRLYDRLSKRLSDNPKLVDRIKKSLDDEIVE